ncbi:MAG: CHASE2 domain-containing protein [Alphaproteobacteria bacterium]
MTKGPKKETADSDESEHLLEPVLPLKRPMKLSMSARLKAAYLWLLKPFVGFAQIFYKAQKFVGQHAVLSLVFIIAMHFFTSLFNPFNIDSTNDENASHFLNLVSSPFYGGMNREGQKEIVVVLVTPEDLQDYLGGDFWPPPYEGQIRVLEKIFPHKPKAVFMDFYYSRPQIAPSKDVSFGNTLGDIVSPAWEEFQNEIEPDRDVDAVNFGQAVTPIKAYDDTFSGTYVEWYAENLRRVRMLSQNKTPLYFGPVGTPGAKKTVSPDGLDPLRKFASDGAADYSGALKISVNFDSVIYYPEEKRDGINPSDMQPAAHALFREYCAGGPKDSCFGFGDYGIANQAVAVKWGYGTLNRISSVPNEAEKLHFNITPTDMKNWRTDIQPCHPTTGLSRATEPVKFFFSSLFNGERIVSQRGSNRCFYHDAMPAKVLFSDISDSQLRYIFEDKIVLIGADQPYLADNFDTPVYGVSPGVFIHAMALDNLIEQGAKHNKIPGGQFWGMDSSDLFSGFMLLIIAFLLYFVHEQDMAKPAQAGKKYIYRWSRYFAIIFVFSIGGMSLAAMMLNWPLGNVFEIGLTAFGMLFILEVLAARPERRKVSK